LHNYFLEDECRLGHAQVVKSLLQGERNDGMPPQRAHCPTVEFSVESDLAI